MQMPTIILLLFLFATNLANGQTDFRKGLESADPIDKDVNMSIEEKVVIHQEFLDKAVAHKDTLKQIYSYLYLYLDYVKLEDYVTASTYILEAKNIAEQSGNKGWQGWVSYRAGIIYVRTRNEDKAIETYEKAVFLCRLAGDSLCIGESYEQLSAMNALNEDFEAAKRYFNLCFPLLEKYGEPKSINTALLNYGNLVSIMGKPAEAIPYMERSIEISKKLENFNAQAKAMNNLADAYRRLGKYAKAVEIYESCLTFNRKHHFDKNRITNYMGLHAVYLDKGNYKLASDYLIKRYELKDSISGDQIQQQIIELEAKYDNKQKELELERNKTQLQEANNRINLIWMLMASILACGGFFFWINRNKRKLLNEQLIQNGENLRQLTQTLVRKNAVIMSLEEKLATNIETGIAHENNEPSDESFYKQSILTADDWSDFKLNYDKAHPGYIQKLRFSFTLSEAEERLFLLLKLKLTRNEIASMLGVSPDTVKKTRNRLRKRLALDRDDSLDDFILSFLVLK